MSILGSPRSGRLVTGRSMNEPLDGRLFGEDQPCFGCAPAHPIGFRLAFEREDGGVVTRFVPDDRYQGPPGVMHGGLVMTLADEVAAWAIIEKLGKFGFTTHAECRLKRPVRIGVETVGHGRVVNANRRVIEVEVMISQNEEVACQATLKFVLLDGGSAERLLNAPLPDAWKKFGR